MTQKFRLGTKQNLFFFLKTPENAVKKKISSNYFFKLFREGVVKRPKMRNNGPILKETCPASIIKCTVHILFMYFECSKGLLTTSLAYLYKASVQYCSPCISE